MITLAEARRWAAAARELAAGTYDSHLKSIFEQLAEGYERVVENLDHSRNAARRKNRPE